MSNSRVPGLTSFTPASTDSVLVYDAATDITKRSTIANLISKGINNILFKILSANDTGTNVNTAQPWFPTAGAVTVEANKTYMFEGLLRLSRSAGTSSHTTSLLFGGTATLTGIAYRAVANTGDVVTSGAVNGNSIEVATATVVKSASTSATEQIGIYVSGVVRVTSAGTFIPQFQYSSAPGGAPSVLANSFFTLIPVGTGAVTESGTWA